MKFLLDENFPKAAAAILEHSGTNGMILAEPNLKAPMTLDLWS